MSSRISSRCCAGALGEVLRPLQRDIGYPVAKESPIDNNRVASRSAMHKLMQILNVPKMKGSGISRQ